MQLPFFVYGTLRAGQSNATLLRGAARTRDAKLGGAQMFDLGPYPMIIAGEGEVWGELIEIEPDKYAAILKSLDRLESVDGNHPENPDALYCRLRCARFWRKTKPKTKLWKHGFTFGREVVARPWLLVGGRRLVEPIRRVSTLKRQIVSPVAR